MGKILFLGINGHRNALGFGPLHHFFNQGTTDHAFVVIFKYDHIDISAIQKTLDAGQQLFLLRGIDVVGSLFIDAQHLMLVSDDTCFDRSRTISALYQSVGRQASLLQQVDEITAVSITSDNRAQERRRAHGLKVDGHVGSPSQPVLLGFDGDNRNRSFGRNAVNLSPEV